MRSLIRPLRPFVPAFLLGAFSVLTILCVPGVFDGAAAHAEASTPDRRPLLLRKSPLLPPYKSAGSGLAPEVKLKVEVDRRGAVDSVEVVKVTPSTEYDEIFREHAIAEISTWRWAPAIEGGEAVPATLTWTVQFQVSEGSIYGGDREIPRTLWLEQSFQRRDHLHSLSRSKKEEILGRYAEVAERFLVEKNRRHYVSPRFVVVTDSENVDTAGIVAQNLEASFDAVSDLHHPNIEPLKHRLKTLVYLYSTRQAFESARTALLPLTQEKSTYYSPGLITYHLELPSSDFLLSFLIHEASHAYSDHHLRPPGVRFPRWFEEGLAEYMGNSTVKKGQLEVGTVRKRRYVFDMNHFSGGARLARTTAGTDLQTVKKKIRSGEGLTLRQMVDAGRAEFYGPDFPIHYGTAWLFVHYLRHGRSEWEDGRFSKLVLYISEGYSDEAAIREVYGHSLAELEKPFLDYVKTF
ncbi:MAG: energy transducer TonB [Acidobacteriota bacterium]